MVGAGKALVGHPVILTLCRAAWIAILAAGTIGLAGNGEARSRTVTFTCTNLASGARWQIGIDFDRGTVDSNSARVSDAEISWRDMKDGSNYTLDRKSGDLTIAGASSTGGYFLHDRCSPEKTGS